MPGTRLTSRAVCAGSAAPRSAATAVTWPSTALSVDRPAARAARCQYRASCSSSSARTPGPTLTCRPAAGAAAERSTAARAAACSSSTGMRWAGRPKETCSGTARRSALAKYGSAARASSSSPAAGSSGRASSSGSAPVSSSRIAGGDCSISWPHHSPRARASSRTRTRPGSPATAASSGASSARVSASSMTSRTGPGARARAAATARASPPAGTSCHWPRAASKAAAARNASRVLPLPDGPAMTRTDAPSGDAHQAARMVCSTSRPVKSTTC